MEDLLNRLQKQLNDLQIENKVLKKLLDEAGISYQYLISQINSQNNIESYDTNQGKRIIHPDKITDEMANKFFARFWGRQDVYSKRYQNKTTGKAGYFPQCKNFWSNICQRKLKTGIPCKDCSYRMYKPLTKEEIIAHLQGKSDTSSDVIGIYPLLKNNTCRFLVFDFDNHEQDDFANVDDTWKEEVEALRKICVLNAIDPLVERSRSGKGAHIWIFFDKPISAQLARQFGMALLDKGAENINLKSFTYYDRMLPAQDILPQGGLGNLIALPLQGQALKNGDSAFIDENWNAYKNQWKILMSKPKLTEEFIKLKIKEWMSFSKHVDDFCLIYIFY